MWPFPYRSFFVDFGGGLRFYGFAGRNVTLTVYPAEHLVVVVEVH
jgi:hypothetical protein